MQDFNDFYFFVQVVDYKGFVLVSCVFGVLKFILSCWIVMFEEYFGVWFVQCFFCWFLVMEIGQYYYNYCKVMLVEVEVVQDVIEQMCVELQGVVWLICLVVMFYV